MTEDSLAPSESQKQKNWLAKLVAIFHEPTREDLLDSLHEANTKHLIDDSALEMMQGVMQFSRLKACDLMVPRAQMVVLDLSEPRESWLPELISAEHSRFPVIMGADKDNVIGILHAKTLLHFLIDENFRAIDHLRPAKFIPESMPLNELLRDFRTERNHMAIIVDEFGGISGLITIEDVLEQIVGDIDDEFDDVNEHANNIVHDPKRLCWRVKALTELDQFDEYFHTQLNQGQCRCDTVGGYILDQLEHMPKAGEIVTIGEFRFTVLRADERKIRLLKLERLENNPTTQKESQ